MNKKPKYKALTYEEAVCLLAISGGEGMYGWYGMTKCTDEPWELGHPDRKWERNNLHLFYAPRHGGCVYILEESSSE